MPYTILVLVFFAELLVLDNVLLILCVCVFFFIGGHLNLGEGGDKILNIWLNQKKKLWSVPGDEHNQRPIISFAIYVYTILIKVQISGAHY